MYVYIIIFKGAKLGALFLPYPKILKQFASASWPELVSNVSSFSGRLNLTQNSGPWFSPVRHKNQPPRECSWGLPNPPQRLKISVQPRTVAHHHFLDPIGALYNKIHRYFLCVSNDNGVIAMHCKREKKILVWRHKTHLAWHFLDSFIHSNEKGAVVCSLFSVFVATYDGGVRQISPHFQRRSPPIPT